MLKFGTGAITQIEKTPEERLIVQASEGLTEAERAGIIAEGEESEAE